jgi:hypothetical protein
MMHFLRATLATLNIVFAMVAAFQGHYDKAAFFVSVAIFIVVTSLYRVTEN